MQSDNQVDVFEVFGVERDLKIKEISVTANVEKFCFIYLFAGIEGR
jgi:hypothetical protein